MHLPGPVDAVVVLVDPLELLDEDLVASGPCGARPGLGRAVADGGDEPTFRRTHGAADDPDPELIQVLVDERDHLVVGRVGSDAKKSEVLRRFSSARRNSRFSRRSLVISSASAMLSPGAWPWSMRSCLHQPRRVWG